MPDQLQLPLLAIEKTQFVDSRPFKNDLLQRTELAENLTKYIDRLKSGAVLAIDAPWGEGKTWFGQNWAKKLKDDDYRVAYIDAFEQDYIDDPFMLLAAELLSMIEDKSQAKMLLTKKAINVVKATASIGTKIGMGLFTKYILGGVDLGEEIEDAISHASNESATLSSQWIEESFEKHNANKNTIKAFKEELARYASSQDKPVVIFIDELDRCKPSFAVSLVERIKHFFDVPNVVFVLLLNRDQLEKAVKGVYGAETDGSAYLGKFINFFFRLPKHKFEDFDSERHIERFVRTTFFKYRFPDGDSSASTIKFIVTLAVAFNLSLRDIEKVIALYAFAYPIHYLSDFLVYVIVLKQKNSTLFQKLVDGDKEAHEKINNKLNFIIEIEKIRGGNWNKFQIFKEWHEAYMNDFESESIGEHIQRVHELLQQNEYDITLKKMLPYFAKKIDLGIER